MESLAPAFAGKRVFITGHTGFKGSWLCEWLLGLGAEVWGYGLPPPTQPALFDQLGLAARLRQQIGDVRDEGLLAKSLNEARPDFIFHLAAQPLVRAAYAQPVETWTTNVLGTINLLEALREFDRPCAVIVVTTDKVYEDTLVHRSHPEGDHLGGHEPYSSSKAAAELATAAWRRSFFPVEKIGSAGGIPIALATGRAGNVIGGGDWAADRLIPDCMRALSRQMPISVRNPNAVRPWQHVLEPLSGYLLLAAKLHSAMETKNQERLAELCTAFNFGPKPADHCPVRTVVQEALKHWPGEWREQAEAGAPAEADFLSLDIAKAQRVLDWHPRWNFAEAIAETVIWYRGANSNQAIGELTRTQIAEYIA